MGKTGGHPWETRGSSAGAQLPCGLATFWNYPTTKLRFAGGAERNYPGTSHSSFHTTFNVLENLRIAATRGIVEQLAFRDAESRAAEFMLSHRLYRSDRTGEVISERFTDLTYPWHRHYTFLRGLDYPAPVTRDLGRATCRSDRPAA